MQPCIEDRETSLEGIRSALDRIAGIPDRIVTDNANADGNRRGIDQRQEIREPEKAVFRPTPAQRSKWEAKQEAGAQRSETRTPRGELGKRCGFAMGVNRKGLGAPAKDTKKKQEDR